MVFQLLPTNDLTSHSPQALAWGSVRALVSVTVLTVSENLRARKLKTVETV